MNQYSLSLEVIAEERSFLVLPYVSITNTESEEFCPIFFIFQYSIFYLSYGLGALEREQLLLLDKSHPVMGAAYIWDLQYTSDIQHF